jgi:hypothetical protein
VNVSQSYSAELKPGMTAALSVPEYPGQTFQAALVSTSAPSSASRHRVLLSRRRPWRSTYPARLMAR